MKSIVKIIVICLVLINIVSLYYLLRLNKEKSSLSVSDVESTLDAVGHTIDDIIDNYNLCLYAKNSDMKTTPDARLYRDCSILIYKYIDKNNKLVKNDLPGSLTGEVMQAVRIELEQLENDQANFFDFIIGSLEKYDGSDNQNMYYEKQAVELSLQVEDSIIRVSHALIDITNTYREKEKSLFNMLTIAAFLVNVVIIVILILQRRPAGQVFIQETPAIRSDSPGAGAAYQIPVEKGTNIKTVFKIILIMLVICNIVSFIILTGQKAEVSRLEENETIPGLETIESNFRLMKAGYTACMIALMAENRSDFIMELFSDSIEGIFFAEESNKKNIYDALGIVNTFKYLRFIDQKLFSLEKAQDLYTDYIYKSLEEYGITEKDYERHTLEAAKLYRSCLDQYDQLSHLIIDYKAEQHIKLMRNILLMNIIIFLINGAMIILLALLIFKKT